jgi:hypothetical protein
VLGSSSEPSASSPFLGDLHTIRKKNEEETGSNKATGGRNNLHFMCPPIEKQTQSSMKIRCPITDIRNTLTDPPWANEQVPSHQHPRVPVRRCVDPCQVGGQQPCPVPNVNHLTSVVWPAAIRRASLKKSTYTHCFPSHAVDQQGHGRWPTGNRWWPGKGRRDPPESPVRQFT